MSLSLYEATVPVYISGLRNLASFLVKAEAFAESGGVQNLGVFTDARLHPDMHPFTRQVQMASDSAKGGAARLAGIEAPSMPDTETTFPELKDRIAKTIAFLETLKADQYAGREDADIELKFPNGAMNFKGRDFLLTFSMPNFYFHVTMSYALLRAQGVPLGKMDFLAGGRQA